MDVYRAAGIRPANLLHIPVYPKRRSSKAGVIILASQLKEAGLPEFPLPAHSHVAAFEFSQAHPTPEKEFFPLPEWLPNAAFGQVLGAAYGSRALENWNQKFKSEAGESASANFVQLSWQFQYSTGSGTRM